jgi:hypothetical protein
VRPLRRLSRSWFADPRLDLLAADYAAQSGMDPQRAPGITAARIYVEQAFGAWRIGGGVFELAAALHERAQSRGAVFRFATRAAGLEQADGAVTGVVLEDGERLAADAVVAAVGGWELDRLAGAPRPGAEPGRGTATLCLRVGAGAGLPTAAGPGSYADAAAGADTAVAAIPAGGATAGRALDQPHGLSLVARREDGSGAAGPLHETVFLFADGSSIRVHVPEDEPTAWTVHVTGQAAAAVGADGGAEVLGKLADRGLDLRALGRVLHVIPAGAAPAELGRGLRGAVLKSPVAQPVRGLYHVGSAARPGPGSGLSTAALSGWQASELIGKAARD